MHAFRLIPEKPSPTATKWGDIKARTILNLYGLTVVGSIETRKKFSNLKPKNTITSMPKTLTTGTASND